MNDHEHRIMANERQFPIHIRKKPPGNICFPHPSGIQGRTTFRFYKAFANSMADFSCPYCTVIYSMLRSISVVVYELGYNTTVLTKILKLARYVCALQIDKTEYVYFKFPSADLKTSDSTILVVASPIMRAALSQSAKVKFGETHHTDAQIETLVSKWYKMTSKNQRNDHAFVQYMVSQILPPGQGLRDELYAFKEFNRLRDFQKHFNPCAKGHSAASICISLLFWLPPFFNLLFIGPCLLARECLYKYPEESILDRIDDIPGRRLICVDHHGKRRQCTDEQLEAFKESRRQCTDEQMETFRQLS